MNDNVWSKFKIHIKTEYIKLQRKVHVCLKTKAVEQRELHKRTPMGNGIGRKTIYINNKVKQKLNPELQNTREKLLHWTQQATNKVQL